MCSAAVFHGHIINGIGFKVASDIVAAIMNKSVPNSKTKIKSFGGWALQKTYPRFRKETCSTSNRGFHWSPFFLRQVNDCGVREFEDCDDLYPSTISAWLWPLLHCSNGCVCSCSWGGALAKRLFRLYPLIAIHKPHDGQDRTELRLFQGKHAF